MLVLLGISYHYFVLQGNSQTKYFKLFVAVEFQNLLEEKSSVNLIVVARKYSWRAARCQRSGSPSVSSL
jgi:hypothetical protein